MSVSQEIKNYVDFINEIRTDGSIGLFIQYNLLYLLTWFKDLFVWLFSFSWVRDFFQLPIYASNWSTTVFSEVFLPYNSIATAFTYENIIEAPSSSLLKTLLNGFLLSLPCSAIYLLWLQQLIVQGIPAAVYSGAGIIIGQLGLFISIVFGFRFLVFSWFATEPFNYFIGLSFILWMVYRTTHTPIKRLKWRDRSILISLFFSSFLLVWTDQTGLFSYFHNLSLSPSSSILEFSATQKGLTVWIEVLFLLIGQSLGLLVIGQLFLFLGRQIIGLWVASYSKWVQIFNFGSLTLVIALTLTSFPYYSLDYLVFAPLGFSSTDQCLSAVQLQTTLKDVSRGRLGECSSHTSVDVDVAPFDRGSYSTGSEIELTFEDLNYQGEYIWRSRNDRLASGSAGVVNRFMSKFLPKPTVANFDSELNKVNQTRPYEQIRQSFSSNQWDCFEGLTERFLEDYSVENDESVQNRILDGTESFSAFSELVKYGFDTFASLDEIASDEFEEALGKKIKLKYYANPVYKLLLRVDISNFLNRQPRHHFLTTEDEQQLFNRRFRLTSYYNSLRTYSKIPYASAFSDLFFGTKSYASRVYNQQFQGTLKILRRLFAINLYNSDTNFSTILKFDQPLYTKKDQLDQLFIHEELLSPKLAIATSNPHPWVKETGLFPFYAGWDSKARQFVITNRWSAATNDFFSTSLNTPLTKKIQGDLNQTKNEKENARIVFTSWPVIATSNNSQGYTFMYEHADFADNQQHDLHDLFEYAESGDYETRLIYETLPSFVRRVDLRNKDKNQVNLSPLTNGLSWKTRR